MILYEYHLKDDLLYFTGFVGEDAMLRYTEKVPLAIPDNAFNSKGAVELTIEGASADGVWVLHCFFPDAPGSAPIGTIETARAPRQPNLAIETARAWVQESCKRDGLRLVTFKNVSARHYPVGQLPYRVYVEWSVRRAS